MATEKKNGRKPGLPGGHPIEAKVVVMFFVAKAVGGHNSGRHGKGSTLWSTRLYFAEECCMWKKTICPCCLSCTVAPV